MRRSEFEEESHRMRLEDQYQNVKSAFIKYVIDKDPFINKSEKLSFYGMSKFLFPGMIAIPCRFIGLLTVFCTTYTVTSILSYRLKNPITKRKKKKNATKEDKDNNTANGDTSSIHSEVNSLKGWRRFAVRNVLRIGSRLTLFCMGYYRIKVKGKYDPKAPILICNHTGPYEGFLLSYLTGACFLSRIENRTLPLIGPLLVISQSMFVDRNSPKSRASTTAQVRHRAAAPQGMWPPLVIFPEGTSASGNMLLHFKPGAFQAGVPVQPCYVKHKYRSLDPSWSSTSHSFFTILFRVMAQWGSTMELTMYDTYYPNTAEKKDPQLYANNVRQYLSNISGLQLSDYSVDDMIIVVAGEKCHIPRGNILMGIESIRKHVGYISIQEIKNYIKVFHDMDSKRVGKLSYGDFLGGLGVTDNTHTRSAFRHLVSMGVVNNNIISTNVNSIPSCATGDNNNNNEMLTLDRDNGPYLTFDNFLAAIVTARHYYATDDNIKEQFEILNICGTDQVTLDEIIAVLEYVAPEVTIAEVTQLFRSIDSRRDNVIDIIEFGTFMRDNPLHMILFEEVRQTERDKKYNPIITILARRKAGNNNNNVSVDSFREEVHRYRNSHANADALD